MTVDKHHFLKPSTRSSNALPILEFQSYIPSNLTQRTHCIVTYDIGLDIVIVCERCFVLQNIDQ